jgi:hypothetical protein
MLRLGDNVDLIPFLNFLHLNSPVDLFASLQPRPVWNGNGREGIKFKSL